MKIPQYPDTGRWIENRIQLDDPAATARDLLTLLRDWRFAPAEEARAIAAIRGAAEALLDRDLILAELRELRPQLEVPTTDTIRRNVCSDMWSMLENL